MPHTVKLSKNYTWQKCLNRHRFEDDMGFISKVIWLVPFIVGGWLHSVSLVAAATPAVYTWGSYDADGQTLGFVNENGEPLETGSVVQLIWSGSNGRVDPPQAATGSVTVDDQIIATRTIPNDADYPPPLRNKGYLLAQLNYDTDQPYQNGYVYMRAWNAPTAGRNGGATAYGDSHLLLLTSSGTGLQLGIMTNHSTATAVTIAKMNSNVWVARPPIFIIAAVLQLLTCAIIIYIRENLRKEERKVKG